MTNAPQSISPAPVASPEASLPNEPSWLVISYFSKIDGMACAQHIDDRLQPLREKGIKPVLLTGICGGKWEEFPHGRVPSAAPSGLRFELRHLKKRSRLVKILMPLLLVPLIPPYLLEKALIDLDSQWSWFPLAILRGVLLCHRHRPQMIYATGGAPSAHLAAAGIARCCGIPWISEFQDPLVHEDWQRSSRALKVFRWLERLICRRADAVMFLTDAARLNACRRTELGDRGRTVYAGADPANMPAVPYRKEDHCHFAHFGSFGGSRNLKVFLEGLQRALDADPELANLVRLDLYGTCDRLSRRLMQEFSYQGVITDHGRVPRRESLIAMKKSDVLLLIQNTERFSSETIPSKSYEYFHTGRPVLGLLFGNPELEEMVSTLGGTAVAADDPAQVQEAVANMVRRWQTGETAVQTPKSPYTVHRAVDSIVDLAQEIISGSDARAVTESKGLQC